MIKRERILDTCLDFFSTTGDVMTLHEWHHQHSDQQQRGGHSHVDGADDFSNVLDNSIRFRLVLDDKARGLRYIN